MRLTFLGTAAAEGYPGIFCDCANCNEARALGGRNLRMRSALLVNDDLLIDFGPDLLAAAQRFNLNLSQVAAALVTHAHEDHFYLGNFTMPPGQFYRPARYPHPAPVWPSGCHGDAGTGLCQPGGPARADHASAGL